jgi:hypothetical protein
MRMLEEPVKRSGRGGGGERRSDRSKGGDLGVEAARGLGLETGVQDGEQGGEAPGEEKDPARVPEAGTRVGRGEGTGLHSMARKKRNPVAAEMENVPVVPFRVTVPASVQAPRVSEPWMR